MANNKMPFVAIIGGIWQLNPTDTVEAQKTAQEIGEALADAGMGLVVYFSNPGSLEPHVVTGYVRKLSPGTGVGSIRVRFADSQIKDVRFAEQETHKDVFERKVIGKDWEAPFYRSLVDAEDVDAVLLMAGKTSTLIAGQIAIARPLPVLAIDKFDGSARDIRIELATASRTQDYPSTETHGIEKSVAWLKNKCIEQAKKQEEAIQMKMNYSNMISQKKKIIWASFAFIALLVTLFFGVARTPPAENYSFVIFSGLIAAGAMGALIRSIRGADEGYPVRSLLLGAVAGLVVGLAYLIPQWIGAPGVLKPLATVVEATDKIQFVSAILVAISAGVGFDTVFNRLNKQAEELPISGSGK